VKKSRHQWRRRVQLVSPNRFVFLDESSAKTNMKRLYGWASNGVRLVDAIPEGHWKTTTMVSAIRSTGVATAMTIDGAIDGLVFRGFTEHFLIPVLHQGDIVVMDNLPSHKVKGVVDMIEDVGAEVWYLPPYSPDFNPIEQMWSKVKSVLRSLARRTRKSLNTAIGNALTQVTESECKNYFAHCGYA